MAPSQLGPDPVRVGTDRVPVLHNSQARVRSLAHHWPGRAYNARVSTFLQDVRYGGRQLLRRKGSSLLAILTLALGVGASTAIFSVVDSTMLRPLPYPAPEQLVSLGITEPRPDGKTSNTGPSMEDLLFLRQASDLFSFVEGFGSTVNGHIAGGAEPERLQTVHFTEGYLAMHGVRPLLGRDFNATDTTRGAPLVALLGYGYWQSRFAGRDVLGDTIRLDDQVATIVGVLPRTFNPNTPVSLPLVMPANEMSRRGSGSRLGVVARLQPGVSIEAAVDLGSARLAGLAPAGSSQPVRLRVTSRLATVTTPQRTTVNVLMGAVALVLLLACVNVAGLLMARGATRRAEVAVRASLGATRMRLVRQLVSESLAIAVPGAALGVMLAWLSLDVLVANVPVVIPSNSPAAINLTVLGATLALLVPTVLIVGLLPAIRLSRVRLNDALATGGRSGAAPLSRRGGQVFIAIEVALAVLLVAGAGLMIRSFSKLAAVDLGYVPNGLLAMNVLPLDRTPGVHTQFYSALVDRISTLPGVTNAAVTDYFHLASGLRSTTVKSTGGFEMVTAYRVSPGYFDTIAATLVTGRWPVAADAQSGPGPVVINQTAARLLFPDGAAIGREITRGGADQVHTVVGVMADLQNGGPTGGRSFLQAHVFFPFTVAERDITAVMTIVTRTSGDPADLAGSFRQIAQSLGPRALVESIRTGEELLSQSVLTPKKRTVMLGLLGGLGLLLALVGIVGVTAYAVTRRTREIGVRLAFGARPAQVAAAVFRDAALPIAAGAVIGVTAAAFATQLIKSFLFETSPTDPVTLASVTLLLVAAGLLAALWPSLRAARIDPVLSLRQD